MRPLLLAVDVSTLHGPGRILGRLHSTQHLDALGNGIQQSTNYPITTMGLCHTSSVLRVHHNYSGEGVP